MNQLESIFQELGISQYLDAFVEQGFDTWETILDITESDLDALGVKLGHRRKLQRRIANHRGVAPVVSLVSPTRASSEDVAVNAMKLAPAASAAGRQEPAPSTATQPTTIVAKRKYRRHPRPDNKAPERPPSAYVLFSNKMREDLKDQNLSFTEIAKLVGENWQNLDRAEKAPYEKQAQEAKEKYNRDTIAYKKTDDYAKYCKYLQDFRNKQAGQDKDTSKRIKTTETPRASGSTQSCRPSRTGSATGSGSDSPNCGEPPSTRQQRLGSATSQPEPSVALPADPHQRVNGIVRSPPQPRPFDEQAGRARGFSSPSACDMSNRHPRRTSLLAEGQRNSAEPSGPGFPWLPSLGMGGAPAISRSPEAGLPTPSLSRVGSGSTSYMSGPPSLTTEQSSTSTASSSSNSSCPPPRTPSEASLPIHALLSSKLEGGGAYAAQTASPILETSLPTHPALPIHQRPGHPLGASMAGGRLPLDGGPQLPASANLLPPPGSQFGERVGEVRDQTAAASSPSGPDPALDGMSALLRASDIVGRHGKQL